MTAATADQAAQKIQATDDQFGDNLGRLRHVRGISRRELADASGVPEHTIEKIENGYGLQFRANPRTRRRATVGEAVAMAEALGVLPAELLRGGAS